MRAAAAASPLRLYRLYARSRERNTASASSSHHAAQLSPSSASGVSARSSAAVKRALATSQRASRSAVQPSSGKRRNPLGRVRGHGALSPAGDAPAGVLRRARDVQ